MILGTTAEVIALVAICQLLIQAVAMPE